MTNDDYVQRCFWGCWSVDIIVDPRPWGSKIMLAPPLCKLLLTTLGRRRRSKNLQKFSIEYANFWANFANVFWAFHFDPSSLVIPKHLWLYPVTITNGYGRLVRHVDQYEVLISDVQGRPGRQNTGPGPGPDLKYFTGPGRAAKIKN